MGSRITKLFTSMLGCGVSHPSVVRVIVMKFRDSVSEILERLTDVSALSVSHQIVELVT